MLSLSLLLSVVAPAQPTVEYNRDVRPILSDVCFHCHGPDKAKRKGDLRLDREEDARRVIDRKNPHQSELLRRLITKDSTQRMPPDNSGKKLTEQQINILRRWLEQGAKWQKHWAFLSPQSLALPNVKKPEWVRNPIDSFILSRLEKEGLSPAPAALKTTLIRRATFDLTGLPPTPDEVSSFLQDTSPNAYEKVLDRLLKSPRYGERMAWRWLEAARYADTNGYQNDGERFMWRWRDWVIDAYNSNLPFDRFTIEQLAGDMLPHATQEQRIATGFNRNHRGNGEGGIIPEEFAVEYVVDRVDTTSTVWLGLTMGCARCHDHKYDPVSQKEFYQVFAYFNNIPERGKAVKFGNSPPLIKAPTRRQQDQLIQIRKQVQAAEKRFQAIQDEIATRQADWEKSSQLAKSSEVWFPDRHLLARFPLDGDQPKPIEVRDGLPSYEAGRIQKAAQFDGKRFLSCGDVGDFGFDDKFTLSCWIYPQSSLGGAIVSRMIEKEHDNGYGFHLVDGKLQLNLVVRWLDDALRVETQRKIAPDRWHHVAVSYDGSRVSGGVQFCIDGQPEKLHILLDDLNQSFNNKEPLRIGSGGGAGSRFHGLIDEVRIYSAALRPAEMKLLAQASSIGELLTIPTAKRTAAQAAKVRAYFLEQHAPEPIRKSYGEQIALREKMEATEERLPTVMVMEEMPTPKECHILLRGEYNKPGAKVSPGVPAAFPPLPAKVPNNRLAFARWLASPENPLTARVTVNRMWQLHFGTGLVKTVEDFGSQGEAPSHPELLDWLATEFVRTGWDVKALHKRIMMSATYRQSSRVNGELAHRDPENRLLARGPRLRLSAEMLRDQALFVSGLLVEKQGGPSVKPYQPKGLWKELSGGAEYSADHGESLYRRSLYTFWKRSVAPPSLMTFDAAGRESCIVREMRTNTPLQALTLLNEETFVESSRKLAERAMKMEKTPDKRIEYAFRSVTARMPTSREKVILLDGLQHHLADYRKNPDAAKKLLTVGESRPDSHLETSELAAYTAIANLLLNLDEVVTKE